MNLSTNFEEAVISDRRVRLATTLVVVPLLALTLAHFVGEQLILGWVILLGAYAVALFTGAISWGAKGNTYRVCQSFVALTSPLIIGGFVSMLYLVLFFFYQVANNPHKLD